MVNNKIMSTDKKTKTIYTDICVTVWVTQQFEVPLEYEINETTPNEAYERLISEFVDQNVDAIQEPCELDLMDVQAIDFNQIGFEFIIHDNQTKQLDYKRFDIEKVI